MKYKHSIAISILSTIVLMLLVHIALLRQEMRAGSTVIMNQPGGLYHSQNIRLGETYRLDLPSCPEAKPIPADGVLKRLTLELRDELVGGGTISSRARLLLSNMVKIVDKDAANR